MVHQAWALHEQAFDRKNNRMDFEYSVDCENSPAAIVLRHYDADVIVTRGGTATGLKEQNQLTPIVEIPITTGDIALSVDKAIQQYGPRPIGVVGTKNMLSAIQYFDKEFPVPVKAYCVDSVSIRDLVAGVEAARADGAEIILGGNHTSHYCATHDIPNGWIYSSVESVFLAITEAKRCAQVSLVERSTSVMFRGIVDHVFEGIITVDRDNLIRTFNPAAASMLGRKAQECIGQPVKMALPEGRLSTILRNGETCTNEIVRINGGNYVLNALPMSHLGQPFGTLVTFQAAHTISDAESRLRDRLRTRGYMAKYHFEDILGDSPAILTAIHQAQRFAPVDSNVLLYGETGTGKELFAQSIHNESQRAGGPFVVLNCAAIPENLIESELFGYESGAFTGASKGGKPGLFEAAHEGTIFLDEISEIPLPLQSRLLRVIQEREVRRIGANHVIPINVRVICATNKDLYQMIRDGKFREDLYYRLKVLSINLPPIRNRAGDVGLLMEHYLSYYAQKFGKTYLRLSPEARALAEGYIWPGNIRELRNISEQLAVLCETDTITAQEMEACLPFSIAPPPPAPPEDPAAPRDIAGGTLESLEQRRIREVLATAKSRKKAAEILGISKTTLWRRCKELGIE